MIKNEAFYINNTERKFLFRYFNSFVVLLLLVHVTACGKGNDDQSNNTQRSNIYTVGESGKTISYDVGGIVDESSFLWPSLPSNERFISSIMVRNTGDTEVVNPRVSINGRRIPLTSEELLSSLTFDSQHSLDRLLKIFYAIDRYSVHEDMSLGHWQESPLTFFVGYGGGMCEDRANIQRMLWDLLRHRSRNSEASNHTVYDVEYDNRIMHLNTGRNILVYSDASDRRSVEVQVDAVPLQTTLPGFAGGALFAPRDNNLVAEAALTFSWPKIDGADMRGYQIQISAFADMRYPLSPTFERMIDKNDVTEYQGRVLFTLPWRGMPPVNRNLYWRVRPYRADLLAGQWSGIFPFKVKGPQAPEGINVTYDQGKVILSWAASPSGTQPLYYEIHSSVLEGFVPMSEPHRLLGFGDQKEAKYTWYDVEATDWPVVPETTLTTTKETRLALFDGSRENADWFSKLGAHFRVIAVDADGSRSCPSPQAHLLSPLIALPDSMELTAGNTILQVPVVSTVGRITTQSPYFLGLWNKPVLKYSLSSPGGQWSIDENLGVIKGTLGASEEVSLVVAVEDQFDGITTKLFNIKAK